MITSKRVKIDKSVANENLRQAAVGAGTLYGIIGYSAKASGQFILFFDSATTPAEGAVPDFMVPVNATSPFVLGFGELGYPFTNGCFVCCSSTQQTKTLGSADCWFNVQLTMRTN